MDWSACTTFPLNLSIDMIVIHISSNTLSRLQYFVFLLLWAMFLHAFTYSRSEFQPSLAPWGSSRWIKGKLKAYVMALWASSPVFGIHFIVNSASLLLHLSFRHLSTLCLVCTHYNYLLYMRFHFIPNPFLYTVLVNYSHFFLVWFFFFNFYYQLSILLSP